MRCGSRSAATESGSRSSSFERAASRWGQPDSVVSEGERRPRLLVGLRLRFAIAGRIRRGRAGVRIVGTTPGRAPLGPAGATREAKTASAQHESLLLGSQCRRSLRDRRCEFSKRGRDSHLGTLLDASAPDGYPASPFLIRLGKAKPLRSNGLRLTTGLVERAAREAIVPESDSRPKAKEARRTEKGGRISGAEAWATRR